VNARSLSDCVLLLIDDEAANLDLLEAFLLPDGYARLLRATDGVEAVALFEEHQPDIVLLDLHMPHRSGFEVIRDVQQRSEPGSFLPILVLTADASSAARARALSQGAHDFLIKPLDMVEVRLRVRNLLRTRLLHHEQRRATYAREHVLSVVAHDLRNPLASIAMDAEMLRHLLPDDEDAVLAGTVQRIERTAGRMHRLIEDLLEVTRVQHGTLAVCAQPVQLMDVVRDAEMMLAPIARSRGLTLEIDGPAALPPVHVDPERIDQVLSNLVGNAIKFTAPGGAVKVSWARRESEVVVAVSDTGRGIAPEHLPHVFRPFWQSGNGGPRSGLGLGLVISRAIIEAHGGRIWIESPPGAGTTVHFSIPFTRPHETGLGRARQELDA
jgi:signal transduction histidine kinase